MLKLLSKWKKKLFYSASLLILSGSIGWFVYKHVPEKRVTITYVQKIQYVNEGHNDTKILLYRRSDDTILHGETITSDSFDNVQIGSSQINNEWSNDSVAALLLFGLIAALCAMFGANIEDDEEPEQTT